MRHRANASTTCLNEVVFDFYDRLNLVTKGLRELRLQSIGYGKDHLVKIAGLVERRAVDALAMMSPPRRPRCAPRDGPRET